MPCHTCNQGTINSCFFTLLYLFDSQCLQVSDSNTSKIIPEDNEGGQEVERVNMEHQCWNWIILEVTVRCCDVEVPFWRPLKTCVSLLLSNHDYHWNFFLAYGVYLLRIFPLYMSSYCSDQSYNHHRRGMDAYNYVPSLLKLWYFEYFKKSFPYWQYMFDKGANT